MHKLTSFFIAVVIFFTVVSATEIFAEDQGVSAFSKDAAYDVTVELSKGMVAKIKRVNISGVVEINNKLFLVASSQGVAKPENAFINFDSVKMILPANGVSEAIVFDSK